MCVTGRHPLKPEVNLHLKVTSTIIIYPLYVYMYTHMHRTTGAFLKDMGRLMHTLKTSFTHTEQNSLTIQLIHMKWHVCASVVLSTDQFSVPVKLVGLYDSTRHD